MANQEALLAEYNSLRQELIQTIQMNLQISVGALPIAAGVATYGFQAQNPIAFLAAIVVLLSALWYTAENKKSMYLIGAYLYAIIEPKIDGLQWETLLVESRKRDLKYPLMISIYALASTGCVFFTWRFLQDYHLFNILLYSCITSLLAGLFILVSIYALHVSSTKYYRDSVNRWKKVEEVLYSAPEATQIKSE